MDYRPLSGNKLKTLLKKAKFEAITVRKKSKKVSRAAYLEYYYSKNKDTGKQERKRSRLQILSLRTKKLSNLIVEIMSRDITPRILRFLVWKILPDFVKNTNPKLRALTFPIGKWVSDCYNEFLQEKAGENPLRYRVYSMGKGKQYFAPSSIPWIVLTQLYPFYSVEQVEVQTPL